MSEWWKVGFGYVCIRNQCGPIEAELWGEGCMC